MKRIAHIYTEYSAKSKKDNYTVWVNRSEGFLHTELEIAGVYESLKDAHQRQQDIAENYRILGYKVTEGETL